MPRLRLMCDYSADPAWWEPSGVMASLAELPLSDALKADLERWAERFEWSDCYLSADSLSSSGLRYFASWAEELAFERQGLELWRRARAELPAGWQLGYHSELLGEDVWAPDDPQLARAVAVAERRLAAEIHQRSLQPEAPVDLSRRPGGEAAGSSPPRPVHAQAERRQGL